MIDDTYSFNGSENELFSLLKAIESVSKGNKKLKKMIEKEFKKHQNIDKNEIVS